MSRKSIGSVITALAAVVLLGHGFLFVSGQAWADQEEELQPKDTDYLPQGAPGEGDKDEERAELPAASILDVKAETDNAGNLMVFVSGDGALPTPKSFTLSGPPRLVVDIPGVSSACSGKSIPAQHTLLKKIRIAEKTDGVRIVFDLAKSKLPPYSIDKQGRTLTISIGGKGGSVPAKGLSTIRAIDFEPSGDGKTTLTIITDRKPVYEIIDSDRNEVLIRFNQYRLPKLLLRPLDTSYFKGAVNRIVPKQSAKGRVDLRIELRDKVPYTVREDGNAVALEFSATEVPPKLDRIAGLEKTGGAQNDQGAKGAGAEAELPPEFAELAKDVSIRPDQPKAASNARSTPKFEMPLSPDRVYTGQKVSLDFQSADMHNVLRLLAEVSNLNIVAGEDVAGKVTMKLNKVPWDQALDVIIAANGLGMMRTGDIIRIAPLDKLKEENQRINELQQAEPLFTEFIQVNYGRAEALKDKIEKIKSCRGTVTFDERTNKVIVKDTQTVIDSSRFLVKSLDGPTRQVVIEGRIVEALNDFAKEVGVQWGHHTSHYEYFIPPGKTEPEKETVVEYPYGTGNEEDVNNGGSKNIWQMHGGIRGTEDDSYTGHPYNYIFNPGIPLSPYGNIGFTFGRLLGIGLNGLDMRLLAMESDGKIHIVSSPKIVTLDNKEAYIQQGAKIPYPKQTQDGISVDFIEATLKLTVVPHITPDNRISLSIMAKKDEPDWTNAVMGVPALQVREAVTELLINSGETVVIGGVTYEKKVKGFRGVPWLSKLPVLGWLFRGTSDTEEKTELLIFLSANTVGLD
ncbi:MAG: type IV pilus secretin PilQ [Pseudomonadota bacterium]